MDLFRALAFILRMNFGAPPAVDVSTIELGPDRIPADVYRARGRRSRGTILSVHGMTVFGYRDPRIVKLCTTLTMSGHTVVSPQYEEIASLRIEMASVDHMVESICAITADPALRPPSGRIGVLAHSFSGGMALAAMLRPEAEERVSVLCSMGGAYDFDLAVESVLARQDENHYPRRVMLWNFLHHSIGRRAALEHALRVSLEDNGYKREEPQLPEVLASLDDQDRELFFRLTDDPELRLHHLERFRPMIAPITDMMARIDEVRVPVIFIHGLNDNVVPASQASETGRRLRERGASVRVDVSPLLDHNRPYIGVRQIPDIVRMLGTFRRFFRLTAG